MKLITCLYVIVFWIGFHNEGVAQVSEMRYDLHPPLKIPLVFSGSFGELRRTHFHSGVDFKTNGKCGYRIYASEDGFVARIVVSPVGYGRAVYIQHPNGLMTVYAHLRNFSPEIEKYVRDYQYANESWAMDVPVKKNRLVVKKGMVLGYSGNAGSSGGPHLHYEVRDVATQEPINPLLFFSAKDNIRPKIQQLYVYSVDKGCDVFSCPVDRFKVYYSNKKYNLGGIKEVEGIGNLGFGVRVKDFINGSWNSCGIYSMRMYVDDKLKYKYEADRFSFSNTSSVNIVKDYWLDVERRIKVYKAWLPENCSFCGVKTCENHGYLKVEKDSVYNVRFIVEDKAGNKSTLRFRVKGDVGKSKRGDRLGERYFAGKENKIQIGDLRVDVGKKALFDDVCFESTIDTVKDAGYYNDFVYEIGGDYVPLRKRVKLSLCVDSCDISKAYYVNAVNGGRLESVGGWFDDDTLFCRVKNLGKYAICFDTVAPKITPLGKYNLKHFGRNGRMLFRVNEKESGINKYEGRVNGQWVMTSYDAKRNLVECVFDKKRIKTGSKYEFVLTVSDKCGNISTYNAVIYL